MSEKGFYTEWCEGQLDLYHAPRATGDPMIDWHIYDQNQKRIWNEINEGNGKHYVSGSYETKKESDGGGMTLGQGCIMLVVAIAMDWFLFTYEGTPNLLELLLLTVAFFGIIGGMYFYFDHANQKKKEEQRAEQNKND